MDNDLRTYFENIKKPWGQLFYKVVWEQLSFIVNSKVLDFGSGFGITANHLAKNNDVVAIEPNADMVMMRIEENKYNQIIGGIEELRCFKDSSFDYVVCHNVLEYAKERKDILKEFCRVIKPNGIISIVKHNRAGRIMQKAIFENNLDEAISIINSETMDTISFGRINYYELTHIIEWVDPISIHIDKVLGIRTFWGLQQNNEIKYNKAWQEKMFKLEMKVSDIDDFIKISFFNHILFRKVF
ncbi:MAG: class I SAM-dependent methyltransferase [Caldicoprobacterales bacterium]